MRGWKYQILQTADQSNCRCRFNTKNVCVAGHRVYSVFRYHYYRCLHYAVLINWKLALVIVAIIPIIGGLFFCAKKVRVIFLQSRQVIDRLNKVINESILGAAIIRVINSQQPEYEKFLEANTKQKSLGLSILRLFGPDTRYHFCLMAGLSIPGHRGKFVNGSMSLGILQPSAAIFPAHFSYTRYRFHEQHHSRPVPVTSA